MTVPTTVSYGSHPDQVTDLWCPARASSGLLLVLLHGGDWRVEHERGYLAPMADALASEGHAVALPEFRRLGGGGGWPATFEDVVAGLEDAARRAAASGQARALVVVGHSAGGHLALWAAAQTLELALPFRGVVALSPSADLVLGHEHDVGGGAVAELLGGAPVDVPDVLAAADPARLTPRVPVRVLAADADPIVPVALARSYAASHGPVVAYRERPGADHFLFTSPGEAEWRETVTAIAIVSEEPA